MTSSAEFSADRKYRYTLTRIWDDKSSSPLLGMIGKNPSDADETKNDPTIAKEIALGQRLKCPGLLKVNMYPYVATDSDDLVRLGESLRLGPEWGVGALVGILEEHGCSPVICCWGTHTNKYLREAIQNRGDAIKRALLAAGIKPMILKLNSDGTPGHPLYLPSNLEPRPWA